MNPYTELHVTPPAADVLPPADEAVPPPRSASRLVPLSAAWPARLTLSGPLSCVLIAAVALPVATAHVPALVLALALTPAAMVALGLRLTYGALVDRVASAGKTTVVAAALASGVGAAACAAALAWALGGSPAWTAVLASAVVTAGTLGAATALRSMELRVGARNRRIFLIGSVAQQQDMQREVERRGDMRIVGSLALDVVGRLSSDRIETLIDAAAPTSLVISRDAIRDEAIVAAASRVHRRGVRVRSLSEFYEQHFAKVPLSDLNASWFLFDVAEIHRPRIYGVFKRVSESVIALGLLLAAAPIVPLILLAIRLDSAGPVFFRQQRVGKDGRPLRLTKFRTMTVHGAGDTDEWATQQIARITRVGAWLRRYRLDEIPQLWHVVLGQLALIGPRPEQPRIVERLQEQIEFYGARHSVRPGITGWAQVNHGYGGSLEDTLEKVQYEFFYIRRQSLRLDLLILIATVRTILLGGGR